MPIVSNQFNLDAPPGFRGFDDQKPVRMYRRNLPHWRQEGAFYAVTFRLGDALPQEKLNELKRHRERWERMHPPPRSEADWTEFAQEVTRRAEHWLDQGYGECYFRDPAIARIMARLLVHYENSKCTVPCFVVMPNHVHAIMSPFGGYELENVLQLMKGYVSFQVNRIREDSGSLWESESYDRIIRDEEHLYDVVQYIGRNGRAAGLSSSEYRRWIDPRWQRAGWDFVDD
jgi:REP element-mobilizing transposase RayT